mmetsp:Transcript_11373/g.20954  ORF Transcript_11373/g.20954 Transcript_11373/m.20954 type:complete len:1597 (+) Transcript_11373:96-4886(+)
MLPEKASVDDEESLTATTTATMRPPPTVAAMTTTGSGDQPPPQPTQPQHHHHDPAADRTSTIVAAAAALDATAVKKMPSLATAGADASATTFPTVRVSDPSISNFGNSSSSESEHQITSAISTSTATTSTSPSLSSAMAPNSNTNNTTAAANDNNRTRKAPPHHSCISRPSSLSSKSRTSSSKPHHAYFASSEEESEAELDEKDSHSSSRVSCNNYVHPMVAAGRGSLTTGSGSTSSNLLRGRGKLAEIASKVSHHSPPSLHSSRVRMSIPPKNRHDATTLPHHASSSGNNNNKPIASIYKTTTSSSSHGNAVPPPPQTVTIAVDKNSSSDGRQTVNILPSPNSSSSLPHHHPLQPSSSTLRSRATAAATELNNPDNIPYTSPTRKRLRKKRRHKHLPHGLPVFKDPRSCMWTSTYDANAPSEDRYSSLVNVLLRPPKTPRGGGVGLKQNENENSNNNTGKNGTTGEAGVGGGSRVGSSGDGSSDEETAVEQQPKKQAGATADAVGATQQTTNNSNNNTASLPSVSNNDNNNEEEEEDEDNTSIIRLSLWSVIDGHGGGCVATYAAEVLLPHIAASVARALKSEIVDRGVCNVNGQLRDANALDLDGLIRSSDRSRHVGKSQVRQREAGIDVVNPNSIHYRSPYEDSESEGDVGAEEDHVSRGTQGSTTLHHHRRHSHAGGSGSDIGGMRSESESEAESEAPVSVASSLLPSNHPITHSMESVTSSVKASIKTAVSPVTQHAPVGTHSPAEVASITRAITDSFLAVDEGWINSIDPVTTHQTSCVSNGRWNAGACALVVFTIQRLDWCRSSRVVDHETHQLRERGASGSGHGLGFFEDTSHNKDAARRRKLDYAAKKCKSVSSLSTMSSTSSITTEANTTEMLVEESEITEAEDDDGPRPRRHREKGSSHHHRMIDDPHNPDGDGFCIATPASCKCHYYRPHDAMLYTAHVGDCRAVMLGSAPPRTIKVPPDRSQMHPGMHDNKMSLSLDHSDRSEDESENSSNSESIADEISSIEGHDSDSSGEDMMEDHHFLGSTTSSSRSRGAPSGGAAGGTMLGYGRRGSSKRQRRNKNAEKNSAIYEQPFVPLPPLSRWSSEESAVESDDSMSTTAQDEEHRHLPPLGSIRTTAHTTVGRGAVVRGVERVVERVVGVSAGVSSVGSELLETEDELGLRSVRSGSPTQMDRPPSPTQLVADPIHPPPLPLSMLMRPIDLTTDHSAYNPAEVTAVLRRCNNAPKAISSASSGGIKRVAGSLAVTRAFGDAYLKTPRLSFFPYKRHAPYITARPEVNCRVLTKGADRILLLASDGVWERASGDDVLRWVRNYYNARIAGVKEQHLQYDNGGGMMEEEQHDQYDDVGDAAVTEKSLSRRKHGGGGGSGRLSTNNRGNDVLGNTAVAGNSGEIGSKQDGTLLNLTPPVDNTTKTPAEDAATAAMAHGGDDKVEDSDATETTSEITAATTTADDMTTTATVTKAAGTKRKHSAVDETSVSSRSASSMTASSRGREGLGGGGIGGTTTSSSRSQNRHHHHLRSSSSRPSSLTIPTVSDVIVRKVLNKVRKTRNISSLRMLMSLPKGRARRSKHDDITASVVDLSGFVS